MNKKTSDMLRRIILRGGCAVLYLPAHIVFLVEWLVDGTSEMKEEMKYFIIHGEKRPRDYI
jgi:hypothetical protein